MLPADLLTEAGEVDALHLLKEFGKMSRIVEAQCKSRFLGGHIAMGGVTHGFQGEAVLYMFLGAGPAGLFYHFVEVIGRNVLQAGVFGHFVFLVKMIVQVIEKGFQDAVLVPVLYFVGDESFDAAAFDEEKAQVRGGGFQVKIVRGIGFGNGLDAEFSESGSFIGRDKERFGLCTTREKAQGLQKARIDAAGLQEFFGKQEKIPLHTRIGTEPVYLLRAYEMYILIFDREIGKVDLVNTRTAGDPQHGEKVVPVRCSFRVLLARFFLLQGFGHKAGRQIDFRDADLRTCQHGIKIQIQ